MYRLAQEIQWQQKQTWWRIHGTQSLSGYTDTKWLNNWIALWTSRQGAPCRGALERADTELPAEWRAAALREGSGSRIGRRQHRGWKGDTRRGQFRSKSWHPGSWVGRTIQGSGRLQVALSVCVTSLMLVPLDVFPSSVYETLSIVCSRVYRLTLMTCIRGPCDTEVRTQALEQTDLLSNPGSIADCLCDVGQNVASLSAFVSSVKRGANYY